MADIPANILDSFERAYQRPASNGTSLSRSRSYDSIPKAGVSFALPSARGASQRPPKSSKEHAKERARQLWLRPWRVPDFANNTDGIEGLISMLETNVDASIECVDEVKGSISTFRERIQARHQALDAMSARLHLTSAKSNTRSSLFVQ